MAETPSYRRTFILHHGFLKPHNWSLIVSLLLAVGSQAAAVGMAFLTGDGLQRAVQSADEREIWIVALALLALGLVRALLMLGRRLISGRQALGVEFDMRNGMYAKLQRLSFRFYDQHQTGQLMSRATVDLQAVRFFLGYGLIFFFQHVITVVGVIVVMFLLDWRLALAATAITPLIVVVAYRYSSVSHPVLRDVQQKMADLAPVAARRPEEGGGRGHGRGGEHRRRPCREVLRSGAQRKWEIHEPFRGSLRTQRRREPPAGLLRAAALLLAATCPGDRPAAGRTDGRERRPHAGRVHHVQRARRDARHAAGDRPPRERAIPARDGVGRTDLRGDGRARRGGRSARRRRAPAGRGTGPLRACLVRLRRAPSGRPGNRSRAAAGQDGGADRAYGLGQDDAFRARAPVLRRDGRPDHDRWSRRPRRDRRLAPPPDRHRRPGSIPVLGDGSREHRFRPPRCHGSRGRGGGAARAGC